MMQAGDALKIILESVPVLGNCTVALSRSCGYALPSPVIAGEKIPPFDSAGMDGYAVRYQDVGSTPVTLRVIGEIAAGMTAETGLSIGEAYRISTGAMVPPGCSAVIPKEWAEPGTEGTVTILRPGEEGIHIRLAGADAVPGSEILKKGKVIRPQEICLLSSLGIGYLTVVRHPSVAVCSTGSELVASGKPRSEGKVRDANRPLLLALVTETGCDPVDFGIVPDSRAELESALAKGLAADCCITSGGVSAGEHDHVIEVLEHLGADIRVRKVNIRPGMPFVFGMYAGRPVFGLPGNPVSVFVTWRQFVMPALRKMMGYENPGECVRLRAVITESIMKHDRRKHFVRGVLREENGSFVVRPTGSQQSNLITSLTQSNCLIILAEDVSRVSPGDEVEVEML